MAESKINSNRVLLWTNPSPEVAFAAQQVFIDLTNFCEVEIIFSYAKPSQNYGQSIMNFNRSSKQYTAICPQRAGSPIAQRTVVVSANNVSFGGGGYSNGTTYTNDTQYCVPQYIFGVKSCGIIIA